MNALGRHLLLELKDCDPEVLNDLEFLKSSLTETAVQIGATVIGDSFHQFSPQGVSGVVIISESHLFIHTWPEYSYAAVDVFTCGEKVDPMLAVEPLVEKLGSKSSSVIELKRGILQDTKLAVS
ncbi:MAG: S-adenosylmethionine decarboxylase proenzyme [Chloroflexi bacterium]|nr:S-adenosylmethionine decarboxylase proenzyme [Chloroflexota bacterium]MBM3166146.1 S-adenosylmethionine decarboxylase proenzyme [Chloroflexota bacterium]MBM3182766.1 S-adenosylmethionine decarboxylase proenzyme [Chloroflexota bacterium]MBM4452188.1 S-adenosylmethionine decarboxylase proenzyme [Chloroflexota bacterium]